MTSPSWPGDTFTRWSRQALTLAGYLVPTGLRREWLAEWEAELWQLRSQGGKPGELTLFLLGACWHGLWERKEEWKMESLVQDVRFAVRTLARSPGFTLTAVALLTLSIGAVTALFSVMEKAILADPPFPEPDRLVVVDMLFGLPDTGMNPSEWSYPRYLALKEEVGSLESLAGYGSRTMTLSDPGDPMVIPVEVATPSLFPALGVNAERGRVFGPTEEDDGSPKMVALVSHSFWQERMGASPRAVGSTLTLDRLRFSVLGVLPAGFTGITGGAEVWIPLAALREVEEPGALEDAWNQHFNVLGRLVQGTTMEAARSEVQAFGATIMERFPPPVAASRLTAAANLISFKEARVNPGASRSMLALFAAVVMVLLIATANLAGLLLARGVTRQREAAIRASLGAGRVRLLRQHLAESLVLAAIGGFLGVLLAWLGVGALGRRLGEALGTGGGRGLEFFDPAAVALDWRIAAFSLLLTAGVGIAFGILPAWQAARTDATQWLKGGSFYHGSRKGLMGITGRDGLVAVQVAVALVLLAGASLMFRSVHNLQGIDLGFDADGLLTGIYSLSVADEEAGVDAAGFHLEFLERARALPGVTGAALGEVPMGGPTWRTIVLGSEGRPELDPAEHLWMRLQPVSDGYLKVLGADLLEGRDIETGDDWNTDRVIVLNRTAAEDLFPDGHSIGQRIQLSWSGYGGTGARVVGMVEDLRLDGPGGIRQRQGFVPLRQAPQLEAGIVIRSDRNPSSLIPSLRAALAEVGPTIALTSVMPLEQRTLAVTARSRVVTLLLGAFGVVSVLLVAAGLYGTIAFAVACRTRELGLRASLGADRANLAGLVMRHGLGITLFGVAAGVLGSLWTMRLMEGLLFGTEALDPLVLATVSTLLLLVAAAATYLPARRATRIDPVVALRTE